MLIRDALQRLQSATLSRTSKVALVCSFEPLHLRTYLQAYLVDRFPDETPEVVAFGYDQLQAGLSATSSSLKASPALLCLSWNDLHPALSWRTRSTQPPSADEIAAEGSRLRIALMDWMAARRGAETFIAPPPLEFLPLLDSCSAGALGPLSLTASALLTNLLADLAGAGARILRVPASDLNFRDLLLAGFPFQAEHAELVARGFAAVAFPVEPRKKAIVTDLDGTLWHGVIGEDGPAALACGAEGRGYPHRVLQQFLLKLKAEGILLAFCSKNNPGDVLPVFDSLDMPLKLADFSAWRCDWEPKSSGIRGIARDLNIGDDALVVIDDDASELAEIAGALPAAACFATPRDGHAWLELFRGVQDLCATWQVSETDRLRAASVASERVRSRALAGTDGATPAHDGLSHLAGLQLEVTVQKDAFEDPRSLELINRTNQFNLTGERLTPEEWLHWSGVPAAFCWSVRLKDRFGDFGTICVVTGVVAGPAIRLRQFVLSCRAFSRGVEAMVLGELVGQYDVRDVRGPFIDTGRNEPARRFLAGAGADLTGPEWAVERARVLDLSRSVVAQTRAVIRTPAAGVRA